MTEYQLKELRKRLLDLETECGGDTEILHVEQDKSLLEAIGDPEVTEIFNRSEKWYA